MTNLRDGPFRFRAIATTGASLLTRQTAMLLDDRCENTITKYELIRKKFSSGFTDANAKRCRGATDARTSSAFAIGPTEFGLARPMR